MGGGQEEFNKSQQFYKTCDELDNVKYFVHFPNNNNLEIFNTAKLHDALTKQVDLRLDAYSIRHTKLDVSGGGGGGFETFLEILKALWDNKQILVFVVSIGTFIHRILNSYINNINLPLKPRVLLAFVIESQSNISKIDKKTLHYLISNRISNLLNVANSISESLSEDLKAIRFDISVEAQIKYINYSVMFSLNSEQNSIFNRSRYLRIIKNIKIRSNHFCNYSVTKWLAIRRSDGKRFTTDCSSVGRAYASNKFLLISTGILSDYFI